MTIVTPASELAIRSAILATLRQARDAGAADELVLAALLGISAGLLATVRPGAVLVVEGGE